MALVYGAFIVAFLIAVNALYVAGEFGAVSARKSRIRQLADEGHWLASKVAPMLQDPLGLDRWISACQIGITLASLVLGAYGEAKLAPLLAPILRDVGGLSERSAYSTAVVIVLVVLTVLQMIIGELIPKSIALQFPTQTTLFTALPIRWSLRAFSLFIRTLNGTSRALVSLFGIEPAQHRHVHSAEEIELLIADSSSGGVLEPEEKEQLRRALRLGMRDVRQMMVPRSQIEAIDISASGSELLRAIAGPYTRLPVYKGRFDTMIGVIHAKDVVVRQLEAGKVGPVKDLMRPVLHIRDDALAGDVIALLRAHATRFAIVKDPSGYVVGLVTLQDVLASVIGSVPADEAAVRVVQARKSTPRPLFGRRR